MPMREYAQILRLLAEKVYDARLPTGKAVRDVSDVNEWLTGLVELAEQSSSLKEFCEKI